MKFTTVIGAWIVVLTLGGGWLFVSNVPTAAFTSFTSDPIPTIGDAEVAVRERLRDPDSAQFKNVVAVGRKAVCGNVNARNGFGGYTGFTPFIYYAYGEVWISSANPRSKGEYSAEYIVRQCKDMMAEAAK